jgi:PAS domain S-box-containing protein
MKREISKSAGSPGGAASATDNQFYHDVFESIEDYAVFTTDINGIVNSWNKGAEHVLGYKEKEILGKNCSVLFTKADNEKQEPAKELKNALLYGRAIDERFHVRKGGTRFWGSGKVFPVYNAEKQHIGFTKIMRNLTDRMQAEERITKVRHFAEGIIDKAAEPIIVLNEDLKVNTANDAFLESYGIARRKNFDKPLSKFANGYFDKPEIEDITKELKYGRGNVLNKELHLEVKNNDKRILLINGRKISPDLDATMYMLSVQDITEQRMLEQQKDDFISIASHEIRTPLTVIKATAQLLEHRFKGFENAEVTKAASKINEKTDKLLTLIRYLLDASQIAVNELVMRPEQFSLNELVKESVDELILIYPGLSIVVKGKLKENIFADRFRISQVLNNLLNNAIKYSPPGKGIIVRIGKNGKADQARVSVQDFGIGIPKEEQKNLFKRFWRASTAKQRNIAGIGLGLHISSQIIKSHNGKLGFKSEKNEGSTFTFSLPLKNT